MPAAADVQTAKGLGHSKSGKPEAGDSITLTFAGAVVPSLVLAGWSGSATSITVHFQENGANDVVTFRNGSRQLAALGSIALGGDYSETVDFTGSTMTASGNTIVIVLGQRVGRVRGERSNTTMVWTTPTRAVTESGAADREF
jgi:hypothetical protein